MAREDLEIIWKSANFEQVWKWKIEEMTERKFAQTIYKPNDNDEYTLSNKNYKIR